MSCRSFHMPWPGVPPKAAGVRSDRSKRNVVAFTSWSAEARATSSEYALAGTFEFGEVKPPRPAQIEADSGDARYCRRACAPLLFLIITATSPAPTTAGWEPLTDGNAKNFASTPGFDLVLCVMFVAAKSPSMTTAPFLLVPKACVTLSAKVVCSAFGWNRFFCFQKALMMVSASFTDGSVHGI